LYNSEKLLKIEKEYQLSNELNKQLFYE